MSGGIATVTGSSSTSGAPPQASSTTAGRTRTTRSCTPTESIAEGPIALVEVQGYVYEAKLRIADVYEALGDSPRADRLRAEASELRAAFNEVFWDPDEGFFALALDGRKNQVRSVTSNPAHCLYCGIVDDDKAALVAERLMAADMFSGWGIRTLSGSSPAYNPMSYHNGSIWPHDNAIAAAGLKRYGFDAATNRIAAALFDVASDARDFRLPELFCGFQRDGSRAIVAYPVACIPQAWAAAAPFMLLQAMLGISAHAPHNSLTVDRPRLPDWLGRRRDPRHPRRQLEGKPRVSPDRTQHRVLAARAAGQRAGHDDDMTAAEDAPSTDPALPAPLARRFEAIVFDWDGTAVPERGADATRMRGPRRAGLRSGNRAGGRERHTRGQRRQPARRASGRSRRACAGAQPRV